MRLVIAGRVRYRVRHVVREGLVLGHHAVGHVRWVRELGAVHEVIHRCTTRGDVREVKVSVPLVTVALTAIFVVVAPLLRGQ